MAVSPARRRPQPGAVAYSVVSSLMWRIVNHYSRILSGGQAFIVRAVFLIWQVGKPVVGQLRILDELTKQEVPAGVMGEVWQRHHERRVTYYYRGAASSRNDDGWETMGDLGAHANTVQCCSARCRSVAVVSVLLLRIVSLGSSMSSGVRFL